MSKYLVALAIVSVSVSAAAQPLGNPQNAPAAGQAQTAKPKMVKKVVCEENDEPTSNIRRVCRTIKVPAQPAPATDQASGAAVQEPNSGN
jgi:hypothetical protein